ncbi:MAG: thioredoxin domain-containing protein [Deltaproteobacteria bacterium]|nr:thioredoxin domain-containing protein [Deltaproteobacteria bacterium]
MIKVPGPGIKSFYCLLSLKILAFISIFFLIVSASALASSQRDLHRYDIPLGNSYAMGTPDAAITIVEFGDFQCSFCARAHPILERLVLEHKDVRLVWKFALHPFHDWARGAASAALAAGEQGKFWEMHRLLFEHQDDLREEQIFMLAKELGLDMKAFRKSFLSPAHQHIMDEDTKLARSLDVYSTPTLFLNGQKIVGIRPFEVMVQVLDEERRLLARWEAPAGVSPSRAKTPMDRAMVDLIFKPPRARPTGTIRVGDEAPDFTLPGTHGKPVHLSAFRGEKNIVLAFFPAAWTPV